MLLSIKLISCLNLKIEPIKTVLNRHNSNVAIIKKPRSTKKDKLDTLKGSRLSKKVKINKNIKPGINIISVKEKQLSASLIKSVPVTFNAIINRLTEKIGFNCDKAIEEVTTFHDEMIKNHSVVEGTARFNMIRSYSIRMLEGQNPDPLTRVAVGKKDRWPSGFNQLRPLYYRVRDHKCPIADRAVRSILYLNRLCDGNGVPNFTEIRKTHVVPEEFRERYRNYLKFNVAPGSFELVTKPSTRVLSNGPNGKPKWQTADLEAYALINSTLHEDFKQLCDVTGNSDLYNYMSYLASTHNRVERKRLRFLTTVRDKGNKCRLVAISDYWTQVILEPIMADVQSYTKERFAKVSYSSAHEKGFVNLKKFIRPGVKSYDISSWTDAFPAVLQLDFMKARYGDQIANCWYNLVVSCEWDVKGSQSTIKYNRGQGMGTNGSFDIATITDLFLLEMIYKEDYKRNISVTTYNKVGDDLWCYDPKGHILNTYTQICGIDINLSKTKSATKENLCGEFVSRNLNYGVDVSRISANICRAVKKNILDVPQLALHLSERDCEFTIPLRELFAINKIRSDKLQRDLVRTFYLLCKLYSRPGFKLLQKSVREEFPEVYYEDDFINVIKTFGVSSVRDSYNVFIIDALYKSIQAKTELVFDSASEFDSSEILSGRCEPELLWTNNEPIGLMTSKYILAKTFRSLNELYAYPEFKESSDILSALEKTDQAMTFKELGVISTSGEVWRPRATKLFNFVKHLVVLEPYTSTSTDDISSGDFSEGNRFLATTNVVSVNDPIYKGTNLDMIGHTTMSTNLVSGSDCSQRVKPYVSHVAKTKEVVSFNDSIY